MKICKDRERVGKIRWCKSLNLVVISSTQLWRLRQQVLLSGLRNLEGRNFLWICLAIWEANIELWFCQANIDSHGLEEFYFPLIYSLFFSTDQIILLRCKMTTVYSSACWIHFHEMEHLLFQITLKGGGLGKTYVTCCYLREVCELGLNEFQTVYFQICEIKAGSKLTRLRVQQPWTN